MKYQCLNCGDRIKIHLLTGELDALECDACGAYPLCFNCALCPECASRQQAATPSAEVAER